MICNSPTTLEKFEHDLVPLAQDGRAHQPAGSPAGGGPAGRHQRDRYMRSHDAVGDLARSHATRTALDRLLQNMLNAETGLRGYLLTGDDH